MSKKVKVPQWFDELASDWMDSDDHKQDAVARIVCHNVWGTTYEQDVWLSKHWQTAVKAIMDGYEVEEPRYLIKIVPNRFLAMYWSHDEAVLYTTALPYAVSNQPSQDYRFKFTESDYRELWNHNVTWQPFLPPFDETDPHFEKVSDEDA